MTFRWHVLSAVWILSRGVLGACMRSLVRKCRLLRFVTTGTKESKAKFAGLLRWVRTSSMTRGCTKIGRNISWEWLDVVKVQRYVLFGNGLSTFLYPVQEMGFPCLGNTRRYCGLASLFNSFDLFSSSLEKAYHFLTLFPFSPCL